MNARLLAAKYELQELHSIRIKYLTTRAIFRQIEDHGSPVQAPALPSNSERSSNVPFFSFLTLFILTASSIFIAQKQNHSSHISYFTGY